MMNGVHRRASVLTGIHTKKTLQRHRSATVDVAGVVALAGGTASAAGTCPVELRERRTFLIKPHGRDDSNPGTNLHVSGLHPRVTERTLEDAFSKYGKVRPHIFGPHSPVWLFTL